MKTTRPASSTPKRSRKAATKTTASARVRSGSHPTSRAVVKPAAAKKGSAATKKPATAKKPAAAKPKSDREHVYEILKGFSTVMLVTAGGGEGGATLRARPMSVAQLAEDCTLTFMISRDSSKGEEAKQPEVTSVIAQGKMRFVSLSGRAEIVSDRARIHAAWKPADKVYFPAGKDDPNIVLVVFHPADAELWDMSGAKGLKFLFQAARALITGEAPKHDRDTHDRVTLDAK